ncbi:UDP-N-acetylglucosamine 2-epimerase [Pontibacter locisalis]|uniref:UDP-N-acetylglucosamine 2-epimerase n=1 Tax=Pontibacter locisalis TaxID=1719035 RepID=A0ABW5IKP5_9BACT
MIKIGVLTSSRSDFGVYLPLLNRMKADEEISFSIIAFGTHISKFHGNTVDEILEQGFEVQYKLPTLLTDDSEEGISSSTALCALKFSSFWATYKDRFDFVFCLGDRFEMFAAVSAGVPFGIKFVHFCGGDVSLGAIDNVYRDCLTRFSSIHFPTTTTCAERVNKLKNEDEPVKAVGLLSLDDIDNLELLTLEEFKDKWGIDLAIPSILVTFHPETIGSEKNIKYSQVIYETLLELGEDYQLIVTMPNADTEGYLFREIFYQIKSLLPEKVILIENFGRTSYFTCMKYSRLLIGNSSSGISEAASFNKYAINIGSRQKGRETGPNTFNVDFDTAEILALAVKVLRDPVFEGENIYRKAGGVDEIIKTIKHLILNG